MRDMHNHCSWNLFNVYMLLLFFFELAQSNHVQYITCSFFFLLNSRQWMLAADGSAVTLTHFPLEGHILIWHVTGSFSY